MMPRPIRGLAVGLVTRHGANRNVVRSEVDIRIRLTCEFARVVTTEGYPDPEWKPTPRFQSIPAGALVACWPRVRPHEV
jgi:hypothetical protein